MRVNLTCGLAVGFLPLATACNLLMPLAIMGVEKKKVPAEFDKLAERRAAVLVWTDPATLFDYPHARMELATYVGDKLQAELNQRSLAAQIVDPRDVEDFLQKDLDARIDPHAVGRRFDADYVIYVEVVGFQIRDPSQPQFLRGRISASVSVHDVRSESDSLRRFELTPVECVYPEDQPVLMTATNSSLIREATYRKFAEEVARKFYDYTVEL